MVRSGLEGWLIRRVVRSGLEGWKGGLRVGLEGW